MSKIADGDKLLEFLAPEEDKVSDAPPWKVLVVDDDPDVHAARALSLLGVEIQGRPIKLINAYSGKEARKIIESSETANVALADCAMETDMAGIEFARHVKRVLRKKIPIIVIISGHADVLDKDLKSFSDIDGFLNKTDCTRGALIELLEKWLPKSLEVSE